MNNGLNFVARAPKSETKHEKAHNFKLMKKNLEHKRTVDGRKEKKSTKQNENSKCE